MVTHRRMFVNLTWFLLLLLPAVFLPGCGCGSSAAAGKLTVTLLNVAAPVAEQFVAGDEHAMEYRTAGVGDAILISTPGGKHYLIDGGLWGRGEAVIVPALIARGITRLEMVIISHAHGDHYGGLEYVLANFPVKMLATNGISQSTASYRDLLRAAKAKGIAYRELKENDVLNWDEGVTATVLKSATRELDWHDNNNQSVVIKLVYGQTSFLFTGDASWQAEEYLLKHHRDELACTVLKVGHHSSTSSSTVDFLLAVHPRYGLASVDGDNRFDFPPVATLEKYQAAIIPFLCTGTAGEITATSDGREVTVAPAPPATAAAAIDPKMLDGLRLSDRAWPLVQAKNYEGAIPLLEEAATLAPNSASIHSRLGYCYKKVRDFDAARRELARAVELNPAESYAQLHLGHLYHIIDHDEVKAGEHLRLYLRQQPHGQFADLAREWLGEPPAANRRPAPREEES